LKRFLLAFICAAAIAVAQEHAPEKHEGQQAAAEHHAEAGDPFLGWKWINFGLLAAGLVYLGVKFGGPFFRERAAGIGKDLNDSARIKAEAEAKAAAIEARIANLESEIAQMRQASRQELSTEQTRVEEETGRILAKIEEHAASEIASALKAAKQSLSVEAARLAVDLAGNQLKGRMDAEVRAGLVSGFIRDLEKSKN
jgi:F-type H+-transporting ATPase subunit b